MTGFSNGRCFCTLERVQGKGAKVCSSAALGEDSPEVL